MLSVYSSSGMSLTKWNDANFPQKDLVTKCLYMANDNFDDMGVVESFATDIIRENDHGNIDEAWSVLKRALNYSLEEQ